MMFSYIGFEVLIRSRLQRSGHSLDTAPIFDIPGECHHLSLVGIDSAVIIDPPVMAKVESHQGWKYYLIPDTCPGRRTPYPNSPIILRCRSAEYI